MGHCGAILLNDMLLAGVVIALRVAFNRSGFCSAISDLLSFFSGVVVGEYFQVPVGSKKIWPEVSFWLRPILLLKRLFIEKDFSKEYKNLEGC